MKTKLLVTLILLCELANAQGTWTQKSDFPWLGRTSASGFAIGTKGYLVCGETVNATHGHEFWEWDQITGVKEINLPSGFNLSQNHPNPWNPTTTINYSIAKEGNVKLTVYNFIGSKVATIVNEYKPAGNYSFEFNGSNLASGIYLYRLESGNYSAAKKFILLKWVPG